MTKSAVNGIQPSEYSNLEVTSSHYERTSRLRSDIEQVNVKSPSAWIQSTAGKSQSHHRRGYMEQQGDRVVLRREAVLVRDADCVRARPMGGCNNGGHRLPPEETRMPMIVLVLFNPFTSSMARTSSCTALCRAAACKGTESTQESPSLAGT